MANYFNIIQRRYHSKKQIMCIKRLNIKQLERRYLIKKKFKMLRNYRICLLNFELFFCMHVLRMLAKYIHDKIV